MPRRIRYGADKTGEEMPDWIVDKKPRAERIRQAKAELEAEAKAAAEAKLKAAAEAQQQREAELWKNRGAGRMAGIEWHRGLPSDAMRRKRLLIIGYPKNRNYDVLDDGRPDIFVEHF